MAVLRTSLWFRVPALALGLTGCGGQSPTPAPQPAAAPTLQAAPEVQPAPNPPPARFPPTGMRDTTAALSGPPIVVVGAPAANRSIKARGLDLGLLLLVAATHQRINIAALGVTTQVSADLHYDEASALLKALETVGGIRRISSGLKTSGVAWFVPREWPDPAARVSLAGRPCERVDMEFLHAPLPEALTLLSDIMGTKLSGVSGLAQRPLTVQIRGVRCDRLLADILQLSDNSATLKDGLLTIHASSHRSDPSVQSDGDAGSDCPEQTPSQSAFLSRDKTGLHCNRVDQVRLAAVAYDERTRRAVAAIVPATGRPGRHALVRVGNGIILRGADGDPVRLRVTEVANDQVIVTGSEPSSRYAFGLSLTAVTQTLAPLPASSTPEADASAVDIDCVLDPVLPKCARPTPRAND